GKPAARAQGVGRSPEPYRKNRSRSRNPQLSGRIFKNLDRDDLEKNAPDLPGIPYLRRMEQKFEMSLPRPRVSVVVAARNEVDRLWHCLFALKTRTYPPDEIILVDNASHDTTLDFVRSNYPQVKVLECQEIFGRT